LACGTEKPYYIKQKGYSEAGCFIRVGSSSQPMSQEMIDRLLAKRHPLSLANISARRQDLEFEQLKLYYGLRKSPLNNNFAHSLDFMTLEDKYNMSAYLFADNNNISIRVGKYSGTDKSDLIGREDFRDCCLITAMKKVLDRFDIENITQSQKRPMETRIDKLLVDKAVLHEVIINAFAHNDYSHNLDTPIFQIFSDRFEITSFGGLVRGLNLDKFYAGTSMPRNREIVRVFKDLGYVEQLGNGIPKIVEKYGRNAIAIDGFIIQTTLKFDIEISHKISHGSVGGGGEDTNNKTIEETSNKTQNKIKTELKKRPSITANDLAEVVGITVSGVRWQINKLKNQGIIRRIGAKKGGYWEVIEK
jgi:predicted HTH transcriptional regulator